MRRFKQALPSSENIAILKQKTHGILALCDKKSFPYINTVIESLVNLKPKRKRDIKDEASLGAIVRDIEKQIANLDAYQKKAALEISNGPQRIRGLAGSGKTIILALKAAYLHTAFPDKKICITSIKTNKIDSRKD